MDNKGAKINTALYGDKPVRAETIYCDKTESCSFYKNKKCLNVTQFLCPHCKFGEIVRKDGVTPRARSYNAFVQKHREDETYGKLKYPSNSWRFGEIDDYYCLNLVWKIVEKRDYMYNEWVNTEDYRVRNATYTSTISYIEKDCFTHELLDKICSAPCRALMGGEIKDYQSKVIPNLLFEISQKLPEFYREFLQAYPKYESITPNHAEKTAKLKTLNRDCIYSDSHGNKFKWEGDDLVCEDYHSAFLPFGAKTATMRVKPDDGTLYRVDDNVQVTEDTVFE